MAAVEHGVVRHSGGIDSEGDEHYGVCLAIGQCPRCRTLVAAEAQQVRIGGYDAHDDEWGDFVRVYPKPPRTFSSRRIPTAVTHSILEAEKAIQANAHTAACVMLGRALEGVCQNLLVPKSQAPSATATAHAGRKRPMMLGEGIRKLKENGLIDERLFDWSQQLHAFRNVAAHPTDVSISREDAEDLQSFVYAIIEYIYDLTDRYNEFKERVSKRKTK